MFLLIPTIHSRSGCKHWSLHSNMFLLIPVVFFALHQRHLSLHSNMFLLIPEFSRMSRKPGIFTFQYVSINTLSGSVLVPIYPSLHSNMFLLIPIRPDAQSHTTSFFTFQYVSINTGFLYLLIHLRIILYIPICFY